MIAIVIAAAVAAAGATLCTRPAPTLARTPTTRSRFLIGQYVTIHGDVISHVNISHVMVEDGGEYSCVASNRAGKVSHSARLNVYGKHIIGILYDSHTHTITLQ